MRTPTPVLIVILLFAALAAVASCGGDDTDAPSSTLTASPTVKPTPDLELVPYFQELDEIFQRASDDSVTADAALGEALTGAPDLTTRKAAYSTFLAATESVFANALLAMNGLEVPAKAENGHEEFLIAAAASRDLAANLRAGIVAAATEEQFDALLEDFGDDSEPLLTAADAACDKLQETAVTHGVDVDLACG